MKSSFSVIIPLYNKEREIEATIRSVLAQTLQPLEIVVVNDGSKDRSAEIVRSIDSPLIRLIDQPNAGECAARNRAIDRAKGEYLSFIDSDDYIEPDMYSRLLSLIEETGADMACGAMWIEKTDGEKFCRVPEGVRKCWNTREALVELNSYRYLYTSFCCAIFLFCATVGRAVNNKIRVSI
jgi:glycosyltransferase involved in cell wall biosynthesis